MVARVQVRVNYAGVGVVLKSTGVREMVDEAAANIQANVPVEIDGEYLETDLEQYTTDRAAAAVVVKHPIAAYYQARDGILTRAAGAAGLEVSSGD